MAFHVGQKVVCVNDNLPANPWHRANPLVKGQIYIVQHLYIKCIDIDGSGRGWENCRFRPLIERKIKTGMAILREILDRETVNDKPPVRVKVNE